MNAAYLERKRRNQKEYRDRIKNKGKVEIRGIYVDAENAEKIKLEIQALVDRLGV